MNRPTSTLVWQARSSVFPPAAFSFAIDPEKTGIDVNRSLKIMTVEVAVGGKP